LVLMTDRTQSSFSQVRYDEQVVSISLVEGRFRDTEVADTTVAINRLYHKPRWYGALGM
jgi:hypothetical protein